MRRLIPALLLLALAGATHIGATASADPGQACSRGLTVAAQAEDHPICSHGPDALNTAGSVGLPVGGGVAPPAPCIGDGVSGARIEVMYGVPADVTNDYTNKVASIRAAVAAADQYFEGSDAATTQHLRWLCDSTATLQVDNVTLLPIGSDGAFTYSDLYNSLVPRGKSKRSSTTFNAADRDYVVFVDGIGSAYPYCGQGGVDADDSAAATNRNNTGPAYALIACWSGTTALHEIGHNLGAVQLSAPHSSGAYHCYDESDVMCYNDHGPYFAGPDGVYGTSDDRSLVSACAAPPVLPGATSSPDTQFDCNEDDYYNPAPAAGSYLATHWNLARSAWVQP